MRPSQPPRRQKKDDVHSLSELAVAFARIEERLETFVERFNEERSGAAQDRRDLRAVIDALSGAVRSLTQEVADVRPMVGEYGKTRNEMALLTSAVARIAERLDEIEPPVKDYIDTMAQARGAGKAMLYLKASALFLAGTLIPLIWILIKSGQNGAFVGG